MANPQDALNRALAHHRDGDWALAEAIYQQVLQTEPAQADALHLLGFLQHQRGDSASALAPIQRAIALAPRVAFYHANLGLVNLALGQPEAARACFLQAHQLDPGVADTCNHLGALCAARREHPEALAWYGRALALQPDYADAHNNLGLVQAAMGQHANAVASFRHAVALRPGFALALSGLANSLSRLGLADEAIAAARQAVQLDPAVPFGWSHLGSPLQHSGAVAEAMQAFEQAQARPAELPVNHLNLALCRLLMGDLESGWAAYECRFEVPAFKPLAPPPRCPTWQGEPLAGRSILVMAEQGLGDVIQFARYAPLLQARGARVVLQCQPALQRLMASLPGTWRVVGTDQAPPDTDLAIHVMSLPHRFDTRQGSIPAAVPYLQPEPAAVVRWRRLLNPLQDGPRIGLLWQGSASHGADGYRSLPLAALDPLAGLAGVHFVSLQHGGLQAPVEGPMAARLVDHGDAIGDFADLAGLVANLDLVITVDTAVAHLAGAMARPVWLLLHAGPDFRWLMQRDDSPWYPTARLFRQQRIGDWAEVVERMRLALAAWCGAPGACEDRSSVTAGELRTQR